MHNISSPNGSDDGIEAILQAKGLNAPRVTKDDFNANIVDVEILKHVSKGGQVLRWAILTTKSGFAVTGRPSVAVSPENDDESVGVQVATDNARNELWPLMGYALRESLFARPVISTRSGAEMDALIHSSQRGAIIDVQNTVADARLAPINLTNLPGGEQ